MLSIMPLCYACTSFSGIRGCHRSLAAALHFLHLFNCAIGFAGKPQSKVAIDWVSREKPRRFGKIFKEDVHACQQVRLPDVTVVYSAA